MTQITLTAQQTTQVLYYETGFDQLHPVLEVHDWMTSLGMEYRSDWNCFREHNGNYVMEFPNDIIAELFVLKWL